MEGRIVLDGMNREIIGAVERGHAPWDKPVTEGEVNFRAADMYANSEMSGLTGWYLEAVADRRGWDSHQWWTAFDTAQDCRRMKPEAEPVLALEMEPVGRRIVTRVDRWFCAAQFMPGEVQGPKRRRIIGGVNDLGVVSACMAGWLPDLRLWNMSGAVRYLEDGEMGRPDFGEHVVIAGYLRDELVLGILSRALGVNGARDYDMPPPVRPDELYEAVDRDPFFLARVAMEAEFAGRRLLSPVNSFSDYGLETGRREALEVHFDRMRHEERLRYLTVPEGEEAEVRTADGRFDDVEKRWYVPPDRDINDFARWDLPSTLRPGAEFAGIMRHHGLAIKGNAIMDGEWHRVLLHGQDGDAKPAGLYRSAPDGGPGGEFRNYRDGDGRMMEWTPEGYRASPDIRRSEAMQREWQDRAYHKSVINEQAGAARRAKHRWQQGVAGFDAATHDFLSGIGVGAHGIRMTETDRTLLVPARDADGDIHALQMIRFDPEQGRFRADLTPNSRIRGCCHLIGAERSAGNRSAGNRSGGEPLIVTEDYVTAAAIHEATGRPVAVAFEGYNLKPVAEMLRSRMPGREIVVAANCDLHDRIRDIGLEEAGDAARAVGGAVAMPHLPEHMMNTDRVSFACVAAEIGAEALRHQIEAVIGGDAETAVLMDGAAARGPGREPPVLMSREPAPEGWTPPDERVDRTPADRRAEQRRSAGRSR